MADLDADDREKIPTKEFGLPEKARTKEAKKQSGKGSVWFRVLVCR